MAKLFTASGQYTPKGLELSKSMGPQIAKLMAQLEAEGFSHAESFYFLHELADVWWVFDRKRK